MADKKETADAAPKKKGKIKKILIGGVALLVLVGGGVGAGVYASNAGLLGGGHAAVDDGKPKLVPKSEQKHPTEGEGGGHGGDEAAPENHGMKPPAGEGGDKYASTYYPMEKEFTSNLQDSAHFVQVGIAVATPYDDTVITNLKTNDIAVRSAILMALGDTTEEQVMSSDGKRQLQVRLAKAINDTLKQKEGFGGIGNVYFTSFVVQ
ncbi:flagellar basal body-associated FliL family protein [Sphingomonas sp. UV9]|uniref:flagellar basal body-associated FliL family protein n=1 Tax=Sphingomonas sp. UV9 TaxID=1851410 RepID=UPI000FFBED97|nr:flagellar basal body-associated FliL family protein [Sphingomonas sp. UV9]RXD04999.1 flagellar basal body-associated FliL family protein [Sphingomonas sp. UV9]